MAPGVVIGRGVRARWSGEVIGQLPDVSPPSRHSATSLDALARYGVPQARTLLRLLSCLGAATPVPDDLRRGVVPAAAVPVGLTCGR